MSSPTPVFAWLLAAVVVAGAGAWVVTSPAHTDPSGRSTGAAPDAVVSDATPLPAGVVGLPMGATARLSVTLSLASPDPTGLSGFLAGVENPTSPEYRHFLTEAQFVTDYAPSVGEAQSVAESLKAAGGTAVTVFPDHSAVVVSLSPSEIHALFGLEVVQYGSDDGHPLYTALGSLSLGPSLQGRISGVSGLSDARYEPLSSNLEASPLRPVEGPSQYVSVPPGDEWFVGSDYTQVYGATSLFPGSTSVAGATFPTKVAIATLLASAYNQTLNVNLPGYDPSVVDAYFNATFPASWPLPNISGVPVTVDGVTPPMPASFGNVNDTSADEYENSLDLEMAGSMAPGASVVNFYFAGSLLQNATSDAEIADDFALELSDALAYNYGSARLAVVSGSFGIPDLNASAWTFETAEAAATGVTLTIASGDEGDAPNSLTGRDDGQWPTWPASADTNTSGAIAVGGVSISLAGQPIATYTENETELNLSYDSNITGVSNTTVWYNTQEGVIGTEGGVSLVYPEPYWQNRSAAQPAIVNATERQGASAIGRAEPDVAMPANDTIATVWANATEGIYFTVLQGTSVSAPVLAGLLADVVAVESNRSASGWAPLGFFDPTIYNISSYFAANPSSADPFSSVTSGENYIFTASPGWDALTGWGTVNATLLLAADENATITGYHYTGSSPGLPPTASSKPSGPIPYTEIYLIIGAAVVVAIVILVLATRPRKPAGMPASIPYGAQIGGGGPFGPGTQGGIYPGATFLCPYCGAVRPAEPVRCPQCGAY